MDLLTGVVVSLPAAWLAHRGGRITRGGTFVGLALASVIYAAFYLAGLLVLGVALALTIAATRTTRVRRERHVPADDDRRSSANILANCSIGGLAAMTELTPWDLHPEITALWFVTAVAAGASDTVASEIGKAFDAQPRAFPTFRRVAPGTPGAVSIAGTIAGVIASALIAWPAIGFWLLPPTSVFPVVVCCVVAAFVESTLATLFEARGLIGNHALNLINTGIAAGAALLWRAS